MLNSYFENLGIMIPLKQYVMPTVTILCGIQTSGKSTWTKQRIGYGTVSISRDEIRIKVFGKNYKHSSINEKTVTTLFNQEINNYIFRKFNIILDNCYCKEEYINEMLKRFQNTGYIINIKFFYISLWKAYYRNLIRRWRDKKWIPMNIIKKFKRSYDKIDRSKYEQYRIY